jgi:arsenite-transporting ATPase
MSVAETAVAVRSLIEQDMPAPRIVINRVTPPPPRPCECCDARRAFESRAIAAVRSAFPRAVLVGVATRDREPRGVRALAGVAGDLESPVPMRIRPRAGRVRRWRAAVPPRHADVVSRLGAPGTRLVMFGGKGGVGKTTCAAAAALELAHRSPDRRVLLLSTDPADSLADALGEPLSDTPRTLRQAPANLSVRELDASRAYRQIRDRYANAIDGVFDRLSRGSSVDASIDRQVMHELIELAPPGVDELAAVIEVTDALAGIDGPGRHDLIVMDTAPSGHALRLLEMPSVIQDWTKAMMELLLKYRSVGGIGELGPLLLTLSKGLGRLRQLLADPAQTTFVAVTRAARLPRAETTRVVSKLVALGIHVPLVVVNATGRGTCARCRRAAAEERREMAELGRAVRGSGGRSRALAIAPGMLPPPHGAASLRGWVRTWYPMDGPARANGRP